VASGEPALVLTESLLGEVYGLKVSIIDIGGRRLVLTI
jgi:ABC-type cobalamin transport system ATPase subunit